MNSILWFCFAVLVIIDFALCIRGLILTDKLISVFEKKWPEKYKELNCARYLSMGFYNRRKWYDFMWSQEDLGDEEIRYIKNKAKEYGIFFIYL